MKDTKLWALSVLWVAVATLMPMAALEPVAVAGTKEAPVQTAALCSAPASAALDCESHRL